ncbi:ABC transporter substrate-binding protein [Pseudomonas sp. NPDC089743]|uniref:ABC transporter substrate-binding protein n=1 Tax=Pseudomonas sp. NPDC089743 TaxID=3364471 RepID=UPI00382AF4C8
MKRCPPLLYAGMLALASLQAQAEAPRFSDDVIRIGILNDRSGPYADVSGEGSAIAARMAAEEFGNRVLGVPVEIVTADHQNKTDVGAAIARKWLDADGVDMIADIANSAVSLAISGLVQTREKLILHNSASASITGAACTPRTAQWQYNAWAAAHNVVNRQMVEQGMDSFFIIAVDYALGESISSVFEQAVQQAGGKVVGHVRHPLNTTDFSSYLLQARASGAKAIMLANAGVDLATAARQAQEFGLTPGVQLLAAALTKDVIKATGLQIMEGLQTLSWYEMYRDDQARAWGEAFAARNQGRVPTEMQAATYSSVRSYLKAIEAVGTDQADVVMAQLKRMPINDAFAKDGHVRADGLMSHEMYLTRLKSPDQSAGDGDYSNILATLSGSQVDRPLAQSDCPLLEDSQRLAAARPQEAAHD